MVKIRLKRMGAAKRPYYRIVVTYSRSPRDGRFIDEVGVYQPLVKEEENQVKVDAEKVKKWFLDGAQPTNIVRKLLNKKQFKFDRAELLKK